MRSQVLGGDKSRPLAYDVAYVTSPRAVCFSFAQPKNSGCRRQKRRGDPLKAVVSRAYIFRSIFFHCLQITRMFLEIYPSNLPLFCTNVSGLRLMHSSRAEFSAEVFGSSAGPRPTRMVSSKYDVRSLYLGCTEPNSALIVTKFVFYRPRSVAY